MSKTKTTKTTKTKTESKMKLDELSLNKLMRAAAERTAYAQQHAIMRAEHAAAVSALIKEHDKEGKVAAIEQRMNETVERHNKAHAMVNNTLEKVSKKFGISLEELVINDETGEITRKAPEPVIPSKT